MALKMLDGQRASAWKLQRWCFVLSASKPLILAGDAFGEAQVEGAALSGLSAAEQLLELL